MNLECKPKNISTQIIFSSPLGEKADLYSYM